MIKEAGAEDLKDVLSLYRQLFVNEDYNKSETFSERWSEIINDRKIKCFLAYYNGTPVSTCILTIIPNLTRNQRPYALIENVVTHRDYRRRGFGKVVIDKAINYAKEKDCYKIMLLSDSSRTEAHRFYESLGFDGNAKAGFLMRLS